MSLQSRSFYRNERNSSRSGDQGHKISLYCHVCCEASLYFSRPQRCKACKSVSLEIVAENSIPIQSTPTYQSPPLVRETRQPLILQNGRIMEASSLEQRRKSEKVGKYLVVLIINFNISDFKKDVLCGSNLHFKKHTRS